MPSSSQSSVDAARIPSAAPGSGASRGPLTAGERVQLCDAKGRKHTIALVGGGAFHTHRGILFHDDLIERDEGIVATNTTGIAYQILRPLLTDIVLSMPRGAAIVYPKDAAQIVGFADIFPGATVLEAGVGSGALTMSLLRAVGADGSLHSIERREDFAGIAAENVEEFFGGPHPAWSLTIGDFQDVALDLGRDADRVVLDMLAPWECVDAVGEVLVPGGLVICYVATATQLSRMAEALRAHGEFTEPIAWETMMRLWHLEGLAVRPEHRMNGHTGFLISSRRMAPGNRRLERRRRPAKGAYPADGEAFGHVAPNDEATAGGEGRADPDPADFGERPVSDRKVRRVHRDLVARRERRTEIQADQQFEENI